MTTCYYCSGPHEDDPCPVRVADAERYRRQGWELYPSSACVRWLDSVLVELGAIASQDDPHRAPGIEMAKQAYAKLLDARNQIQSQQWICGLERDRKPDSE